MVLIPYAGVQNDESLFAAPIYLWNPKSLCITIFHRQIPLMMMSYLGTLKSLLYLPIFSVFGVNLWTIRLPPILLGALTVFLLFQLTLRSAGASAAGLAAFLLATDPTFLLTNTYDWGPVAIEHCLLIAGCYLLVRYAQKGASEWHLAGGFFALGLALWNKAIFLWALAGLFCGAVTVFWPEIRRLFTAKRAALATVSFLFGALPFVLYNVRQPNATLGTSGHLDLRGAPHKTLWLRLAVDGSGLFNFLTMPDGSDMKPVRSAPGRVAQWIHNRTGTVRSNGMGYACILLLLAAPWWWQIRAARFSLIFMVVAWTSMAVTRDAGVAIHHTVLIWPFPQFFVAAALASLPFRSIAMSLGAFLVALNLLVVNQYVLDFERNGATGNFSDALFPLTAALNDTSQHIYVIDWGMMNTLALFRQGHLQLFAGDVSLANDSPTEIDRQIIHIMLTDPNGVFVGHAPQREVMVGTRARLEKDAAAAGYHEVILRSIPDSNGRPVFDIFRFVP